MGHTTELISKEIQRLPSACDYWGLTSAKLAHAEKTSAHMELVNGNVSGL